MWIMSLIQAQAKEKGSKTKSLWKQHRMAKQAQKWPEQ